jgi:hypothetical protein
MIAHPHPQMTVPLVDPLQAPTSARLKSLTMIMMVGSAREKNSKLQTMQLKSNLAGPFAFASQYQSFLTYKALV